MYVQILHSLPYIQDLIITLAGKMYKRTHQLKQGLNLVGMLENAICTCIWLHKVELTVPNVGWWKIRS